MTMIRYLSTLFIAIAATFVACQAKPEKVVVYQEGQLASQQEGADVLGKTRSIHLLDDAAPAASAALTTPSGDTHAAAKGSAAAAGGREQSNGPAAALS